MMVNRDGKGWNNNCMSNMLRSMSINLSEDKLRLNLIKMDFYVQYAVWLDLMLYVNWELI
jgi:hypothetical protein